MSDLASCSQCADEENMKLFKVVWREIHSVSAVVDACSPEHAIEKAKCADFDEYYEVESEDAYGPIVPDSYECEIYYEDQD